MKKTASQNGNVIKLRLSAVPEDKRKKLKYSLLLDVGLLYFCTGLFAVLQILFAGENPEITIFLMFLTTGVASFLTAVLVRELYAFTASLVLAIFMFTGCITLLVASGGDLVNAKTILIASLFFGGGCHFFIATENIMKKYRDNFVISAFVMTSFAVTLVICSDWFEINFTIFAVGLTHVLLGANYIAIIVGNNITPKLFPSVFSRRYEQQV